MEMNGTVLINRPVDEVFAYVCDLSHDANWRTGVDRSALRTRDSINVGTVGYTVAGETEVEWRVDVLEPGRRVEWTLLNGPFAGRGGYHLAPVEGSTQFTLVANIEPTGVYKLLGPLFAWIGRRRNQADVEKLRDILE